jgi:hypothetical protein
LPKSRKRKTEAEEHVSTNRNPSKTIVGKIVIVSLALTFVLGGLASLVLVIINIASR